MLKSAGTFHFFAPECCDAKVDEYKGRPTDIWALGVTLYCMMFNVLPFWDPEINEYGILDVILSNPVEQPKDHSRTSLLDQQLISLML